MMSEKIRRRKVIVPDYLLKILWSKSWKIKKSFVLITRIFYTKFSVFCLSLCLCTGWKRGRQTSTDDGLLSTLWLARLWRSFPLIGHHLALELSRCLWVAWLFQLFDRYSCNCLYTSVSSTQDSAQYWTAKCQRHHITTHSLKKSDRLLVNASSKRSVTWQGLVIPGDDCWLSSIMTRLLLRMWILCNDGTREEREGIMIIFWPHLSHLLPGYWLVHYIGLLSTPHPI